MTGVDATALPCWALVDFGTGIRVAGWVEHATIDGQPFVTITPHDREVIKVNAVLVASILPCDETNALAVARRQWAPPAPSPSRAAR